MDCSRLQVGVVMALLLVMFGGCAGDATCTAPSSFQATGNKASSLLQLNSRPAREASEALLGEAADFYAAPDGAGDGNSEASPTSLESCISKLKDAGAQSSCKLLPGTYRSDHTIVLDGFSGAKTITSADPENRAVLAGTKDLSGLTWSPSQECAAAVGGCYVATLPDGVRPWQLFIGKEMLINARWPNADFYRKETLFEATEAWGFSSDQSTFSGPSQCGKLPRADVPDENKCKFEIKGKWQNWQFNAATGICEDVNKKECRASMAGGSVPNVQPAECYMADATPDRATTTGSKPLGQESFSATGATVVLNVGHWTSYSGFVKHHSQGNASFTYDSRPGWNVLKFVHDHTAYYLENHIGLVDAVGEWFFSVDGKLYLKTPDGLTPDDWAAQSGGLSARVQEYMFDILDAQDLTISNIDLFATTIYAAAKDEASRVKGLTYDTLTFDYPHAQKRMLGDVDTLAPTTIGNHPRVDGPVNIAIRNCVFRMSEGGPTIQFSDGHSGYTIENNLFEYIDWSAITGVTRMIKQYKPNCAADPIPFGKGCFGPGAGTLDLPAGSDDGPLLFTRNTVRHHGASGGVGVRGSGTNSRLILNHIYHKTDLQLDGGLISIPKAGAEGTYIAHNWLYDGAPARPHSGKNGLRYDRGQSGCDRDMWGENGRMLRNVVFHTGQAINAKGNGHEIVQNTVMWSGHDPLDDPGTTSGGRDINLYGSEGGIGTCECTDVDCVNRPNDCCVAGDDWTFENKLSKMMGNAMSSSGSGELGGLDWKVSTAAIDDTYKAQGIPQAEFNSAGMIETVLRDPHNLDFRPMPGSVLAHQCIGAYAASAEVYWIPGHQELRATVPVPPDGTTTAKKDLSLAFNQAVGAARHKVFMSLRKKDLEYNAVAGKFKQADLEAPKNIFKPPAEFCQHGAPVYWRVDSYFTGGVRKSGAVWSYTIAEETVTGDSICKSFSGTYGATIDKEEGSPKGVTLFSAFVPLHGGLGPQYSLSSAQVCIKASHERHMRSLQFRLRVKSDWTLLVRLEGQNGKNVKSSEGCFSDTGTKAYPDALGSGETWLKGHLSSERVATIADVLEPIYESKDVELWVYDHFDDQQRGSVESWSIELCFQKAPAQPIPDEGTGACLTHPYT